jgi:hypothetical protein
MADERGSCGSCLQALHEECSGAQCQCRCRGAVITITLLVRGQTIRHSRRISQQELDASVIDPVQRELLHVVDEVLAAYREVSR